MDCSTPGLLFHHPLLESTQTHIHWVSDAIQPSHTLSSPSLPTFNLSQHQGLFKWVSSSHQVAKVLEFQLQYQSFQWIFRTDLLQDGVVGYLAVQGMLAIGLFSDTIVLLHSPLLCPNHQPTPRINQTDHPRKNSSRVRGSNSQTVSFRYPTHQVPLSISPQMCLLPTSTAFPANFFTNSIHPCGHPPSINSILNALNQIQWSKYLLIT